MNTFLKNHIRSITNDEYPTVKENRVLQDQVMARITTMKLPNPDFYEVRMMQNVKSNS